MGAEVKLDQLIDLEQLLMVILNLLQVPSMLMQMKEENFLWSWV